MIWKALGSGWLVVGPKKLLVRFVVILPAQNGICLETNNFQTKKKGSKFLLCSLSTPIPLLGIFFVVGYCWSVGWVRLVTLGWFFFQFDNGNRNIPMWAAMHYVISNVIFYVWNVYFSVRHTRASIPSIHYHRAQASHLRCCFHYGCLDDDDDVFSFYQPVCQSGWLPGKWKWKTCQYVLDWFVSQAVKSVKYYYYRIQWK